MTKETIWIVCLFALGMVVGVSFSVAFTFPDSLSFGTKAQLVLNATLHEALSAWIPLLVFIVMVLILLQLVPPDLCIGEGEDETGGGFLGDPYPGPLNQKRHEGSSWFDWEDEDGRLVFPRDPPNLPRRRR